MDFPLLGVLYFCPDFHCWRSLKVFRTVLYIFWNFHKWRSLDISLYFFCVDFSHHLMTLSSSIRKYFTGYLIFQTIKWNATWELFFPKKYFLPFSKSRNFNAESFLNGKSVLWAQNSHCWFFIFFKIWVLVLYRTVLYRTILRVFILS